MTGRRVSKGGRSAPPFLPILALLVCATALSAVSREEDAVDFHEVVSAPEFAARRAAYVSHIAESEGGGTFAQLVRMAAGRAPDWRPIERSLDKIDHRHDCADFDLHGLLRLLYQFSGSPGLSSEQWDRI
ncbi:MAG TPA: hypothetical protein PKI11_07715, partial [Candidatus Hydrogenedentes bacterium]|nr:hypothetical protein [Candidatus Hydrogenedentota bacterium]